MIRVFTERYTLQYIFSSPPRKGKIGSPKYCFYNSIGNLDHIRKVSYTRLVGWSGLQSTPIRQILFAIREINHSTSILTADIIARHSYTESMEIYAIMHSIGWSLLLFTE